MPLDFAQLTEHRGDVSFTFANEVVNLTYDTEKLTIEFQAALLRLQRESYKIARRKERLMTTIATVTAEDDTDEMAIEDAQAEAAIAQVIADERALLANVDRAILTVVTWWDVIDEKGMLPLTPDMLAKTPLEFKSAVMNAIVEHAKVGEASGATPSKTSPSPLKLKARQVMTSRQRRRGSSSSRLVASSQR